jgi:spermidine/putrescine transport system substrate-binding protein
VDAISYASANVPARKLIKPSILNDPSVYPKDEALAKCELLADLGEATTLLDQYWTEIKAQ